MARFGRKRVGRFSARTQVFPGKRARISVVTPGIKQFRRKVRASSARRVVNPVASMVKE